MDVDFKNTIDEREEIVENDDCLNFQLYLYDKDYKKLCQRTDADIDFDTALYKTDTTFDATINVSKDKDVSLIFVIQSDEYGWSDYEVALSDAEKKTLLNEAENVVQRKCGMSLDEYMSEMLADNEQKPTHTSKKATNDFEK